MVWVLVKNSRLCVCSSLFYLLTAVCFIYFVNFFLFHFFLLLLSLFCKCSQIIVCIHFYSPLFLLLRSFIRSLLYLIIVGALLMAFVAIVVVVVDVVVVIIAYWLWLTDCRRCTISRSLGHFINSKQLSQTTKTATTTNCNYCLYSSKTEKTCPMNFTFEGPRLQYYSAFEHKWW